MGSNAGRDQQHDVSKGHAQRDLEHSLGTTPAMNVSVHPLSVRAPKAGFKRRSVLTDPSLAFEKILQVTVVVDRGRVLDELQNAIHLLARLAAHLLELHGHP